ncbi:MAG: hypothetical protein KKG35_03070 [Proteobacteria bacterium]|nr:hypothetical protein [Pseudomonadota bacterium]
MKLTDIRIGVPMLRIETRVFHATPRKPTAFERVILAVADRFGVDANFNNLPLDRLFIDVLCVVDPTPIVTPTLTELITLDVIRCLSDVESLNTLTLRDIEITERGHRMIAEDMLPAKAMQNDEVFFYDPILQRLLPESQSKAYRPVPPQLSVDVTVFEDVFPEDQIRSKIQGGGYRWFSAASQIEKLESQAVQIYWKDTPSSVELKSGELVIDSIDEGLSSYISSLDCEKAYDRFIAPVFDNHDLQLELFPEIAVDNLNWENFHILPVQRVLFNWPESARVVITNLNHADPSTPDQALPQQAIIIYHDDKDADDIHFEWNENRNGCKLRVKAPAPDPSFLRLTDQHEVRCHRIQATHGGIERQFLVAYQGRISSDDELISNPLRSLSSIFNQKVSQEDLCAAVLWEGESLYMENLLRRLATSNSLLDDLVPAFYSGLADTERVNGTINRNAWDETLFNLLCECINSSEDFELSANEGLLHVLSNYGPYSEKHQSLLLQTLIQKVPLPLNLDELKAIWASFRLLYPGWTSNFPSRLLTQEILKSILESFPKKLDDDLLTEDNGFFRLISSLHQLYEKISKVVGGEGIEGLVGDDDYVALIKAQPQAGLADLAHSWVTEMESLSSALMDYDSILLGTRLELIHSKVTEIGRWSAKLIGALAKNVQSVYVFDTSALIAQPSIVASVCPNELFVVTKRVIDELDDKKLDETLRPSVSEVVRNLRRIKKEQIQFCDGEMSLLPKDYRMKGDNLILSVAVRFRTHKPTLITNDNNLSLKAQAEGIAAMTAGEFEMRIKPKTQHNDQLHRGRPQNPKGNPEGKRSKK